jgi:DNA-binding MarR family transcriptional regulator
MTGELEQAHAMPLTSYDVLRQLALAPERRLRMAELADAVVLSRPGLTGVVKRLESEGQLRREPAPEDGRGTVAVITEEGLARLEEAQGTHVRSIRDRFAAHFSDEELETLAELLARLR